MQDETTADLIKAIEYALSRLIQSHAFSNTVVREAYDTLEAALKKAGV